MRSRTTSPTTPGASQEIDFLPPKYREQRAHRRARVWRVLVIGLFCGLFVLGVVEQRSREEALRDQVAQTRLQHDQALLRQAELAALERELHEAQAEAELFTYLRHPWARTRILSNLLEHLPGSIVVRQLEVKREAVRARGGAEGRGSRRRNPEADQKELDKLLPVERDLDALRRERDPTEAVVVLVGLTRSLADLHRFLGELEQSGLFSKADLLSIESVESQAAGASEFSARIVVRRGYGEPGGPVSATTPERATATRGERPPH